MKHILFFTLIMSNYALLDAMFYPKILNKVKDEYYDSRESQEYTIEKLDKHTRALFVAHGGCYPKGTYADLHLQIEKSKKLLEIKSKILEHINFFSSDFDTSPIRSSMQELARHRESLALLMERLHGLSRSYEHHKEKYLITTMKNSIERLQNVIATKAKEESNAQALFGLSGNSLLEAFSKPYNPYAFFRGKSLFYYLVEQGCAEEVKKILNKHIDLSYKENLNEVPSRIFAKNARDRRLDKKLQKQLKRFALCQQTSLVTDAQKDDEALSAYQKFINMQNDNGSIPLAAACAANNLPLVQLLLRNGASDGQLTEQIYTCFYNALQKGFTNIAQEFLSQQSFVASMSTSRCHQAYEHALKCKNSQLVALLLESISIDKNHEEEQGIFFLHKAVKAANLKAVSFLLERGADPDSLDSLGNSALDYALKNNNHPIIQKLLLHDATVIKSNKDPKVINTFKTMYKKITAKKDQDDFDNKLSSILFELIPHDAPKKALPKKTTLKKVSSKKFSAACDHTDCECHLEIQDRSKAFILELNKELNDQNRLKVIKNLLKKNKETLALFQGLIFKLCKHNLRYIGFILQILEKPKQEVLKLSYFQRAIQEKNLWVLKLLFEKYEKNIFKVSNNRLLHFACLSDDLETVKFVFSEIEKRYAGEDYAEYLNKMDYHYRHCIEYAQDQNVINFLVSKGAVPPVYVEQVRKFPTAERIEEYFDLIYSNDLDELQNLLSCDEIDVAWRNAAGKTGLHAAAEMGACKIIILLLNHGADRNAFYMDNGRQITPAQSLLAAFPSNKIDFSDKHSFNPNYYDEKFFDIFDDEWHEEYTITHDFTLCLPLLFMPLDERYLMFDSQVKVFTAAAKGDVDTLEQFMANNQIDFSWRTKNSVNVSESLLHVAVTGGNWDVVEYLLDEGFPIDTFDSNGDSAFTRIVYTCNKKLIENLLEYDFDINHTDMRGRTIAWDLIIFGNLFGQKRLITVFELLIEEGLDINTLDFKDNTPLHTMIKQDIDMPELFNFLLLYIERDAVNEKGQTVDDLLALSSCEKIKSMLNVT